LPTARPLRLDLSGVIRFIETGDDIWRFSFRPAGTLAGRARIRIDGLCLIL
jgi:hypothetical protein